MTWLERCARSAGVKGRVLVGMVFSVLHVCLRRVCIRVGGVCNERRDYFRRTLFGICGIQAFLLIRYCLASLIWDRISLLGIVRPEESHLDSKSVSMSLAVSEDTFKVRQVMLDDDYREMTGDRINLCRTSEAACMTRTVLAIRHVPGDYMFLRS